MRRISRSMLAAFAFAVFGTSPAGAQTPAPYDPKVAFAQTDRNGDGVVDLGEFHQRLVDVFYSVDADKDGYLNAAELQQLPRPEKLADMDQDGDGRVSLHEFVRIRFEEFEEADTNHDGELTLEEVLFVYGVGKKK